ncbi:MAG: carboxymuconolactone decarboxylase family protein [Verrucomicrobiae bacterium]|nr:carboxymuconolactone decarboxylase family protein [Verrucomicrobiae bacterium]
MAGFDPEQFPLHDLASAPEASQPLLEEVAADFGMIPNLERVLASSPPTLEGYVRLWTLFDQTSLTPIERQVVYLTANFENNCTYCVPWHTLLAQKAGMTAEAIAALREGTEIPDEKLEALRVYTRELIAHRGHPPEASWKAFLAAGYGPEQGLEIVLGLATKLISNYANGIAHTPLDPAVRQLAWSKPE